MKKITLLLSALLLLGWGANGQNILRNIGEKAKQAAEKKIGEKVEGAVDKAIDKATGKKTDSKSSVKGQESGSEEEATAGGVVDFEEIKAKSDFVRGANVFFQDDLSDEKMGEFPSKWDLLNGSECEVVNIKGKNAIRIEGTQIRPLMKDLKYLPEEFTIEFDVLSQPAQEGSGWDATLDIFFFGENYAGTGEDRVFDYRTSVETSSASNNQKGEYDAIAWGWGSWNPNGNKIEGESSREAIRKVFKKNDWNHIAFSFNKRAFKAYLNYSRIVNIPNQKQPRAWSMDGSSDSDKGVYITNIVMAKGAVELYERNATDYSSAVEKAIAETGKFVTTNILFETGKATLKPESMEEIQKVADYMKKNPSARFEVQGHTDNQGSDKVNDPLSQQRAEAVVKALEQQGVDPFNLRPVGKGSHEPVADNSTDEGRAKNRRVEFIKK